MRKLVLTLLSITSCTLLFAQTNTNCANMDPICTNAGLNFTANNTGTDAMVTEPGNNYGCLFSAPDPAWYYLEISNAGTIDMSLSAPQDIDFIIWGPFPNLAAAQASCGSLNTVVDCSYSATANETPSIPNAQVGEVYIMLITNYAGVVQPVTLTQTGGTGATDCSIVNPCFMNFLDANLTACNPATGTFDITGQVQFTDPPTTGQLVVQNCSGDQVVFNAPFVSPINYSILGITADGTPNCDVTAFFTSDPACTLTTPTFTEPVCVCNMDFFSVNFSACDPNTDTYDASGQIQFSSPPLGGQLIVTIDDGVNPPYDTIINPPFISPYNWSISNMITGTGTNATITVQFTADPACSQTINLAVPASCACPADAGTYTATMTGNGNTNFVLCENDQIDFVHNNDHTPPLDLNDPVTPYNPGIWWLIYSCPPTPGLDILADPCFLGVISQNPNWFDINDLLVINSFPPGTFTNNTVYYAPITMYDVNSGVYSLYPPPNLCFDLGPATAVTYLPPITFNSVEDCQAGTVTVTLNGGHPEIFGTNFTASNLQPGNASFVNTTTGNGGTIVISGLLDGDMYSFDVVDVNGCPITVTGGPFVGPDDATINPAGPFCPGDPAFQMTAADPGGNWTANCGGCITGGGLFNPATAGPGTWDITYTIPGACGNTDTEQVIVSNLLDPTITPAGPFCEDAASVNLAAVDPGGTWSGTGITDPNAGTFDPATAGPGTHTITYTIAGTCGGADTENITVDPLDDATINPAGPFCDTDPVFTMTAITGGGTWTANCGACINAATGDFDPAAAGAGTWTIDYVTNGPCPDNSTIQVTVTNVLDPTISPAGPFCESNPPAQLVAVDPGGTWSAPCGACVDAVTGIFDPAVAGPGTWTITYTLGGTCGAVDTEDIIVIPDDDATIVPAGPFCTTDPVFTMTAADPNGVWSAPCGGCINGATGDFDPAAAGAGTWTITYTIAGACGDADTEDVIVTNQLDATITPAGPFCESDPVFTMQPAVDPGGTWTASCGACIDVVTGDFDPGVAGAGTHTITYTLGGNCGDAQNTTVDVNPDQDAAITPVGPFCIGNPTVFLTAVDPGGTWTGNGIIDAVNGEFDPNVAGSGTHIITYTIAGPCGDQQTTTIVVNDPLTVVALTDQTICEALSANIAALASGGDGNYTYTWTDGAGNPVGVGQNLTVTPAATTVYTVTVTDACASTPATASVTITVEPIPAVNFVADNLSGCAPLTVTFTDNSAPPGTICLWDFGDTYTSTDCGTTTHTFTDPGCYDVTLTVTTAAGCTNSLTQNQMICVFDWAVAEFDFTPDSTTIFDPIFSFDNLSSNATSYVWDFGDGETSTDVNPTHLFPATAGIYNVCLEASNVNGCNDTVCHPITILDEFLIYVPNAFTPDGDNFNNDFGPVISGHEPDSYEMFIFDRWGHIIFESHSLNYRWDGSYINSSEIAKEDVYVWKINVRSAINGEKKTYYGHVTLLK